MELEDTKTVLDLKVHLQGLTNILPASQKLLGLKAKGVKMADDSAILADLNVRPNAKIMLMGTPEAQKIVAPPEGFVDDIEDDFELVEEDLAAKDHPDNHAKIRNRLEKIKVPISRSTRSP